MAAEKVELRSVSRRDAGSLLSKQIGTARRWFFNCWMDATARLQTMRAKKFVS